jgi:lambda repressor-like predicted transcriptional regulator
MNDSQKARALADVIDRKYERYTRVIAERLDHKVFTERVNAPGMHNTFD